MHSYDGNLPVLRDQVRFLIGDTGEPWQLTNAEIDAMAARNGSKLYQTAIALCRTLVSKYTRLSGNASVGPFSIDYSGMANNYRTLIEELTAARMAESPPRAFVTGFRAADKEAAEASTAINPLHARIGIHDIDLSREPDGYYR